MIGYVLIGLKTFSWYVMECELFGVCVVSKGEEKACFNFKMIQKVKCEPFISWWISTLIYEALAKATNHYTCWIAQNGWYRSLCTAPWFHDIKNNTQTLWLVQDILILWYDWCKINTLVQQSDWCKINTLMKHSDWCETHILKRQPD